MSQTSKIIDALKVALRERKVTYKDLAKTLELTEAGVKKALTSNTLSVERLELICASIGLTISDVVRLSEYELNVMRSVLTPEQEHLLVSDEAFFVVYYLILSGLSVEEIIQRYTLPPAKVELATYQLQDVGLVKVSAKGTKPVLSRNPIWMEDGPLIKKYGRELAQDFLLHESKASYHRLMFGRLSAESRTLLAHKIQQLETDFAFACEPYDPGQRPDVEMTGLLCKLTPWSFSVLEKYRR